MDNNTGIILTRLREMAGKSQDEVARDIDGATQSIISRHERGTTPVGRKWMERYATYYGVPLDVIAGRVPLESYLPEKKVAPLGPGKTRAVPIIGTIRAGDPILAVEDAEEVIDLPEFMLPSGETVFVLRVKGDSMIGEGIQDGDYAVVKQGECAEENELVAVIVNGDEATLKRVHYFDGVISLKPSNDNYLPTNHRPEDVRILGHVIWTMQRRR